MATTASSFSWTTALIARRRRGRVPSDGRSQTGGAHAVLGGWPFGGRGWKKVELEGTGSDAIGKPQLGYVPASRHRPGWISIQIQSWISSCPSSRDPPSPP